MNILNRILKVATLGFLFLAVLLNGSCARANWEGTYIGKGKIKLNNGDYSEAKETGENMSLSITKESDRVALHIIDRKTSAECVVYGYQDAFNDLAFSDLDYAPKVCELVVDGIPYELRDYMPNGSGERKDREIKIKASFFSRLERDSKNKFEFEFEGKQID